MMITRPEMAICQNEKMLITGRAFLITPRNRSFGIGELVYYVYSTWRWLFILNFRVVRVLPQPQEAMIRPDPSRKISEFAEQPF